MLSYSGEKLNSDGVLTQQVMNAEVPYTVLERGRGRGAECLLEVGHTFSCSGLTWGSFLWSITSG